MSWPQIALGDLCDIKIGKTPARAEPAYWSDGTLPWLSIADMNQGRNLQFTKECVTEAGVRAANMKLVEPGTLLLSYKLSIGKVGIAQIPMYTNEAIAALSDLSSKLEPSFMYWALQHVDLLRGADRAAMGATLNKAKLSEIKFPVPPLDEQRRIAAILDKADALRAKRREAIAKLDQLLQSVFLDMFGDPVTNPKQWPMQPISELAEALRDGPFGSNLKSSHYVPHGVRVVRLQNIGVWKFLEDDVVHISQGHFESLPRNHCVAGDVLIGTLGDPNLRACILPPHVAPALNKADCLMFRVSSRIAVAEYVCGLLNTPSLILSAQHLALGQTRLRISMGRLKELDVPVPPIQLQRTFAQVIKKIGKEARLLQQGADQIETLFTSLQHRAFTGTLYPCLPTSRPSSSPTA